MKCENRIFLCVLTRLFSLKKFEGVLEKLPGNIELFVIHVNNCCEKMFKV